MATIQTGEGMPRGAIVMWSGALDDVPNGWALCDGTDGTPDLIDRFIVGAGAKYASGATGGADSVTLTEAQMPSHGHSGTANTTGNHRHSININSYDGSSSRVGAAHAENGYNTTGYTNYAGNHWHSLSINATGGDAAHENRPPFFALAYIMKV